MMTSLRLLRIICRLNGCSKNVLPSYHQPLPFNSRKYLSLMSTPSQKPSNQEVDFQKKMEVLDLEMGRYGRVSKFNIENILEDVEKTGSLTSLQGLFLLRCCTELMPSKSLKSRLELANDTWNLMSKLGVTVDVSHYNTLLIVYLETGYNFSPLEFLKIMIDDDIKPNKVTFQRLISRCCNSGNVEEVNQVLEHMKNEEIPVNEEILSSLITAHFVNNDINAALNIFKIMESQNISPTISTYSAFLCGYAEKGDLENIQKLIEECKQKEIWVPDKVLLNIVYKLSINNFTDQIDEILSLTSKGGAYVKEANRIIYKLIEKGLDNIAFRIFQTIPRDIKDYETKTGNFFIQTLLDFNAPNDKSAEYCRIFEDEGRTHKAFSSAIQASISSDLYDTSICLMKEWRELGGSIREHYFYPILKAYGETNQEEEIKKLLKEMVQIFELNPSVYTLKNYVVPFLRNNKDEILTILLDCEVDVEHASHAILLHMLADNKIRQVIKFMSTNFLNYRISMLKYSLLQSFKNTEDAPSFVWILHYLYQTSLDYKLNIGTTINTEQKYLSQQFIDSSILEAAEFLSSSTSSKYLTVVLFRNLVDKGLSLSADVIQKIEEKLGDNPMPEVVKSLCALGSGTLVPKPIQREFHTTIMKRLSEIEKLESKAKLLSVTNYKTAENMKRKLFSHYCFSLNEKKVQEILQEFEDSLMSITAPMYALVIEMYAILLKDDQVEIWISKAKEKFTDFKPNKVIILRLANLLVKSGEFEKALCYLAEPTHPKSYSSMSWVSKLLSCVAQNDDEELLQRFYDSLDANGYIQDFGPLLFKAFIQIHISRGNAEAALDKFKWIAENFKFTSMSIPVMKMLIQNNDVIKLEQVLKLVIRHEGRKNGYFQLAIAYIECNQLDEAEKILKKHCSNVYEDTVIHHAMKFYTNNKVDCLERFFEVLNSLKYDVEKLCELLLKSYSIQNEWKKGYNLWLKMQEESINPSNTFVSVVYDAFQENAVDKNEILWEFRDALHNSQIVRATKLLDSLPALHRSDCYAALCKIYSSRGQFSEVIDLWENLRRRYDSDLDSISAEFILSKMLRQNQIESIEKVGALISCDLRSQIRYSYFLTTAYSQSGSMNLFLKSLEKRLEDEPIIMSDVHYKSIIFCINKYPELCKQFESLAYKYLEKNVTEPLQALWILFFLQNDPKSEEIWKDHLKDSRKRTWLIAIDFIGDRPEMLVKLAKNLQESLIGDKIKFYYYRKLIRYCMELTHPKKYQFALECLQRAMTEFSMHRFDINLLVDLQKGLEESGISWPWSSGIHDGDVKLSRTLIKDLVR